MIAGIPVKLVRRPIDFTDEQLKIVAAVIVGIEGGDSHGLAYNVVVDFLARCPGVAPARFVALLDDADTDEEWPAALRDIIASIDTGRVG